MHTELMRGKQVNFCNVKNRLYKLMQEKSTDKSDGLSISSEYSKLTNFKGGTNRMQFLSNTSVATKTLFGRSSADAIIHSNHEEGSNDFKEEEEAQKIIELLTSVNSEHYNKETNQNEVVCDEKGAKVILSKEVYGKIGSYIKNALVRANGGEVGYTIADNTKGSPNYRPNLNVEIITNTEKAGNLLRAIDKGFKRKTGLLDTVEQALEEILLTEKKSRSL